MGIIKGYKFIQDNMKSQNGNTEWKLKQWKKHKGQLIMCESGFHASKTPLQSLNYPYGNKWFMIEAKGQIIRDKDKFCAQEMRLIKELPTKKISVEFAIACAERCLKNFEKKYPKDKRPRQAIQAAKNWLKNPNEENRKKAESARLAAWSVAESAAESAAERKWQEQKLKQIIIKE